MTTLTRLSPGDRVLVTLGEHEAEDTAQDVLRTLKERFPAVEFTVMVGAKSVVVETADEVSGDE